MIDPLAIGICRDCSHLRLYNSESVIDGTVVDRYWFCAVKHRRTSGCTKCNDWSERRADQRPPYGESRWGA